MYILTPIAKNNSQVTTYQILVVQAKAVGSAILRRVVEEFWHDVAQQTGQWTPTTKTPLFKPHFGAESQSISGLAQYRWFFLTNLVKT